MSQTMFNAAEVRDSLMAGKARWAIDTKLALNRDAPLNALGADPRFARLSNVAARLDVDRILAQNFGNLLTAQRKVALGILPQTAVRNASTALTPGGAAGGGAIGRQVDWRSRFGGHWLCTVQDQNPCESCWAFSATALVETMARIEHCVWDKRSEGDVHDGMGTHCGDGNWPNNALDWMRDHGGLADPVCWPYETSNLAYHPTSDRLGRTTRVPDKVEMGDTAQQKRWIDACGPVTGVFEVWHDFDFYGTGVYHKSISANGKPNYSRGLHAILVVGYDEDQQCWICRNSWGGTWGGLGGYFLIGYGEASIDSYSKFGVQGTSPDPVSKRTQRSGGLLESGNGGLHRNFELMIRSHTGQGQQWWRDGGTLAWHTATALGAPGEVAGPCTLIQTSYTRNMEFLYQDHAGGLHHRFFDYTHNAWMDGGRFGNADLRGQPGFIQGTYGAPGNFEVVAPTVDGRLAHLWRLDGPPWTWAESARFGTGIAPCGATLLQSRYGARHTNLEVVAVTKGGAMQHFFRDDSNPAHLDWQPGVTFGAGVQTTPCMIEGQYGTVDEHTIGNFELCVAVGGQVQHWWRNNSGGAMGAWAHSTSFGQNVQAVLGLVEGSFSSDLEVVALLNDGHLQHFWRGGSIWHDGGVFGQA